MHLSSTMHEAIATAVLGAHLLYPINVKKISLYTNNPLYMNNYSTQGFFLHTLVRTNFWQSWKIFAHEN